MSVIIYGPQGSGKTQNAKSLAQHYRMKHVADEWQPGRPIPPNSLILTTTRVPGAIHITAALRAAGIAWPRPQ